MVFACVWEFLPQLGVQVKSCSPGKVGCVAVVPVFSVCVLYNVLYALRGHH